jgi:hypothetical protein
MQCERCGVVWCGRQLALLLQLTRLRFCLDSETCFGRLPARLCRRRGDRLPAVQWDGDGARSASGWVLLLAGVGQKKSPARFRCWA